MEDTGFPIPDLTDALTGCNQTTCVNDPLTASGQPWPTIILAMVGAGLLIYTAVGSGIPTDRRLFGITVIILWTLLWCLLLWVLWKERNWPAAWWMAVIGIAILVLFFVVVIALNLGN